MGRYTPEAWGWSTVDNSSPSSNTEDWSAADSSPSNIDVFCADEMESHWIHKVHPSYRNLLELLLKMIQRPKKIDRGKSEKQQQVIVDIRDIIFKICLFHSFLLHVFKFYQCHIQTDP